MGLGYIGLWEHPWLPLVVPELGEQLPEPQREIVAMP